MMWDTLMTSLRKRSRNAVIRWSTNSEVTMLLGERRYRRARLYLNGITRDPNYEPWLNGAFRAALAARTGSFIDVGANRGQTLMKLLTIDSNRQYVGFEPQIDCCFFIQQFIQQNHLSNHFVLPIGLSDLNGCPQLLKHSNASDPTASIVPGFRPDEFYSSKDYIYVALGDDIVEKIGLSDVAVIKIDVEGGELEVVRGLGRTIKRFSPFVFFEVLNHFLVATGKPLDAKTVAFREQRSSDLEKLLRDAGYTIFNCLPNDRLCEVEAIRPVVSSDLSITDYVAVHQSSRAEFLRNYEGSVGRG